MSKKIKICLIIILVFFICGLCKQTKAVLPQIKPLPAELSALGFNQTIYNNKTGHTNYYDTYIKSEPKDCTQNGSVTVFYRCGQLNCNCSGIYTVSLKAQHKWPNDSNPCDDKCKVCGEKRYSGGHNWKNTKIVAPTCTEGGYQEQQCDRCKLKRNINLPYGGSAPLGHNYQYDHTVNPTCTTHGYNVMKCSRCGSESHSEYTGGNTLGHKYEYRIDKNPTCAKTGSKSKYCVRCNIKQEGSTVTIPATGNHNYKQEIIEPTCKTQGYTKNTCSTCGKTYNDKYTNVVAHNYVFIREQQMTCELNHFKYYECKWCKDRKWENIELTTGHKWEGTICSVCGEKMPTIAGPWDISSNDGASKVTANVCEGTFNGETRYTLIISGNGNMKNFTDNEGVPWKEYANKIYYVSIDNNITNIGDYTFASHNELVSILIPEKVTSIGKGAFLNCGKIEYIYIPSSVTAIGEGCFNLCKNLKTVRLSNNITEIPIGAFKDCTSLKNINLPINLKEIKMQAFYNCNNLQGATIPKTIENIRTDAFYKVNGDIYYYLVSREIVEKYANQSNFKVNFKARDKIYIYEQPINAQINIGEKAIFYCMAGALNNITYQWYKVTGTMITPINGATEYNYQTENLEEADLGIAYFCEVTEEEGNSLRSDTVKAINKNENVEVTITNQPKNAEIARGERATFIIEGQGKNSEVNYTWYYNEGAGEFKEVTKDIGTMYTTENGGSGLDTVAYDNEAYWNRNYMCIVSNRGGSVTSNIVSAVESETKFLVDIRVVEGKTEYVNGQKIDKNKIKVEAIYSDGTTTPVNNYSLSNENELTMEDSGEITIYWLGNSEKINITVEERKIVKIEMTKEPTTTEYKYGQCFDNEGMIIKAIYNDDSVEEITDYGINNEDNLTCKNNVIEIVYGDFKIEYEIFVECNWVEKETVEPTCNEEGFTKYECSVCKDTKKDDYVQILGHNFENYVSNNDATCTEDGTKIAKCTRCEETDTIIDEGSKLEHEYEEEYTVDKEPTCTEDGEKSKHCKNCSAITDITPIERLGHEYEEEYTIDKEPTCTEYGEKSKHCKRCDEISEIEYIEKAEHNVTNYTSRTEATCTENVIKTGICDTCNEEVSIEEEGTALGHEYEENFTVDLEPSCENEGVKSKHCKRCDVVKDVTQIKSLGHSYTNYVSNNDATCTQDGTKTAKCDRCDKTDTITDEGSKKEHTIVIDTGTEPTCTKTGLTEGAHCSVCNEIIEEQKEIQALGHNYQTKVVAPTCTEKGYTEHTCTRCKDTYKDAETTELGHSYTNYVSNNNATCTKDGTKTAKCDRCNKTDTITDVGSMLNHNYKNGVCTMCGKEEDKININTGKYEKLNAYITNIQPETTLSKFKEEIKTNATKIEVFKDKTAIKDQENVATGMKVVFSLNSQKVELTLVVRGDVNGDGEADFKDMSAMNSHRLGKKEIQGAYYLAGNVEINGDSKDKIDFKDMSKLNSFRLHKINEL